MNRLSTWLAVGPHLAIVVGGLATTLYFAVLDPAIAMDFWGESAIDAKMFAYIVALAATAHLATGARFFWRVRHLKTLAARHERTREDDGRLFDGLTQIPRMLLTDMALLWGIMGIGVAAYIGVIHDEDSMRMFRAFFGTTFVGGSLSCFVGWFVSDHLVQREVRRLLPDLRELPSRPDFKLRGVFIAVLVLAWLVPLAVTSWVSYEWAALLVSTPEEEARLGRLVLTIGFMFVVAALLTLTIIRWTLRSIVDPLLEMTDRMRDVAHGEYTARMPIRSNDEIGLLSSGFNKMTRDLAERERIRDIFGRYVSADVLDDLLHGRLELDVGGDARHVAVMFTDIRGFTSIAEDLEPGETLDVVQRYFEEMTTAIHEHGGTVLEYMGDGVLAAFGAPVSLDSAPLEAVRAALEIRSRLNRLPADGPLPEPLRVGIGVHYGKVIAGNLGSRDRMQYGIIGDTVNVAARIENLTRDFDRDILVSAAVQRRVDGEVETEPLGEVELKGRREPVDLFAVG